MIGDKAPKRDLDPRLALSMEHHLLGADFIGVVEVATVESTYPSATVELSVVDPWFSRWPASPRLTIGISEMREYGAQITVGARLVVLLSGGPWVEAPFTQRSVSVFSVQDEVVKCTSGNPLFAVHRTGFICSVKEYVAGAPLTVSRMRADLLANRATYAVQYPELAAYYAGLGRKLEPTATLESAIDRSRLENGGYR